MTCAVFVPTEGAADGSIPFLTYLSGLTCTDENVCQKSGVFNHLSSLNVCKTDIEIVPLEFGC